MLDAWCDAACEAVTRLGIDPSDGEGFDLANMVLFSIMKCDLYRDIFDGYIFEHGVVGQSRICSPNTIDGKPLIYITAFLTDSSEFSTCTKAVTAPVTALTRKAINFLPNSILVKMTAPSHPVVNLRVVTKSHLLTHPSQYLINASEMSFGDYQHLIKPFGHIYFSVSNNEDYVVAENLAGIVGVVSLFRHENDGKLNALSISGISVTPSYRRMGIGTALCLAAATHAKNLSIPLAITAPSEFGKDTIYPKLISEICYQDKLVFEPFFYKFANLFEELELEYFEKVELLNWFQEFVESEYDIDCSQKYFDDRETLALLSRVLKQRSLYIRLKNL